MRAGPTDSGGGAARRRSSAGAADGPRRCGQSPAALIAVLVLVAVIVALVAYAVGRRHGSAPAGTPPVAAAGRRTDARAGVRSLASLPKVPPRPTTFDGCPAGGDGGDRVLNLWKNRTDEATYFPVPLDSVLLLKWPPGIEQKPRARWSRADAAQVARYEGIPLAVQGYLARAKLEGPEAPNCHGADARYRDFHIWLTAGPGEDRRSSVVVEMTPRVRAQHPRWTVAALGRVARARDPVRISGWLMMDQEHPDQVGRTRGTIWELHPVMRVEVLRAGRWVQLDSLRA